MSKQYDGEPRSDRAGRGDKNERLRVTPETALQRFKEIIKTAYNDWEIELPNPNEVYLADSAVEADYGIGRAYNTSDIDILFPEPTSLENKRQVSLFEQDIRDAIGESGVDFNFAKLEDLEAGNAYGRMCKKVKNFSWT